MIDKNHEFVNELLAAYALDAVDDQEIEVIESHAIECDQCREELDAHREVAGLLGSTPAAPPAQVWERIAGEIFPSGAPPMRLNLTGGHRHIFPARVLAIAAAIIFVFAGATGLLRSIGHSQTIQQRQLAAAKTATRLPGAKNVLLTSETKSAWVDAVLMPGGGGYITNANLPVLPQGRVYQLWVFEGDDTPISAGVLGQKLNVTGFASGRNVTEVAITDEAVGGAQIPTSPPLVSAKTSV